MLASLSLSPWTLPRVWMISSNSKEKNFWHKLKTTKSSNFKVKQPESLLVGQSQSQWRNVAYRTDYYISKFRINSRRVHKNCSKYSKLFNFPQDKKKNVSTKFCCYSSLHHIKSIAWFWRNSSHFYGSLLNKNNTC